MAMAEDVAERIREVILEDDGRARSAPSPIVDIDLPPFDSDLDQLALFEHWEELEILELSQRFLRHGAELWRAESGDMKAPASAQHEDSVQDVLDEEEGLELEGDLVTPIEREEDVEVVDESPPEPGPVLVEWLEAVTGAEALHSVRSPGFARWARQECIARKVPRWDVHQALDIARRRICEEAEQLVSLQEAIEVRLLEANYRAALHWSKLYRGDLPRSLALAAAISGLRRASHAFEVHRGHRFLTLGGWWMRQCITRVRHDTMLPIRVPIHRQERRTRMKRALGGMTVTETRALTADDLLELLNAEDGPEWTLQEATTNRLLDRTQRLGDWSSPLDLEPPLDALFDEFRPSPADLPPWFEGHGRLARALDQILEYVERTFDGKRHARTKDIVVRRLQLDGRGRRPALEHLGRKYNVTRERIRQVQEKAFERMRKALDMGHLDV